MDGEAPLLKLLVTVLFCKVLFTTVKEMCNRSGNVGQTVKYGRNVLRWLTLSSRGSCLAALAPTHLQRPSLQRERTGRATNRVSGSDTVIRLSQWEAAKRCFFHCNGAGLDDVDEHVSADLCPDFRCGLEWRFLEAEIVGRALFVEENRERERERPRLEKSPIQIADNHNR